MPDWKDVARNVAEQLGVSLSAFFVYLDGQRATGKCARSQVASAVKRGFGISQK